MRSATRLCFASILISCSLVALPAQAQTPHAPPPPTVKLPADIEPNIRQPGPEIPKEFAAFVGKWGGHWGGSLASNLYVESVSRTGDARGVYVWGTSKSVRTPGATKFRARIEDNVLSWGDSAKGIGFEFKIRSDGKITGERYNRGSAEGIVVMSKME